MSDFSLDKVSFKLIPYSTAKSIYESRGKYEWLIFGKEDSITFYGAYFEDNLCGFYGFKIVKDFAELKCAYTLPEYRGKGISAKSVEFRLSLLRSMGIKRVIASCTGMSINIHLRAGAIITKQYGYITKIEYRL